MRAGDRRLRPAGWARIVSPTPSGMVGGWRRRPAGRALNRARAPPCGAPARQAGGPVAAGNRGAGHPRRREPTSIIRLSNVSVAGSGITKNVVRVWQLYVKVIGFCGSLGF